MLEMRKAQKIYYLQVRAAFGVDFGEISRNLSNDNIGHYALFCFWMGRGRPSACGGFKARETKTLDFSEHITGWIPNQVWNDGEDGFPNFTNEVQHHIKVLLWGKDINRLPRGFLTIDLY